MEQDPADARDETMKVGTSRPRTFASGRYIVRRVLGEGGQKLVYLVHDEVLDRDCALSVIKSELLEPEDLLRLRREAQTMARLGAHSNIVTVLDMGEEDGKPYLVCEYVPAGDLRQELRRAGGALSLEHALSIASDVSRALSVAHARGVIHRDIKPANIWLCDDASAKLGDFGLAFSVDRSRLTVPYTVMGTAAYMSPEQARGETVSERSDLYALGVLLYEMVCGRPPFVDDNLAAVIAQLLTSEPAAPSSHNSEVPPALDALVLQLLAKPPEMRPANAVRVGESLRVIADELRRTRLAAPSLAVSSRATAPAARRAAQPQPVEEHRPARRARRRLLAVVGVILFAGAATAAFVAGFMVFGGNGDPQESSVLQAAATPQVTATPQRISAVGGCRSFALEACRFEYVFSPAVDETGLILAFEVTYRSDSEERCPGIWQPDREALATRVARGELNKLAVVDALGTTHDVTEFGGVSDASGDLPCNEPQLGWLKFGQVPPGPALFHYFEDFAPLGFVVPEAPLAPSPTPVLE